jgi:hypothetical protein
MSSFEAEMIEKVTGMTYPQFGESFMAGSTLAQHALLWVLLRRENRGLKYGDVKFTLDEFEIAFDPVEVDAMREALDGDDLSDDEREALSAFIEEQSAGAEGEASDPPTTSEEESPPT